MSACALFFAATKVPAESLPLRHRQGEVHAFLLVRSDDGKLIGTGDEVNVAVGKAWRSSLVLRFRDGSLDDETATYTQGKTLHLLQDHHVQKGPSFPKPLDMTIATASGTVTYHESKDGKDQVRVEHMDLPSDLGNGILSLMLQNVPSTADATKFSYLVATPQPRLVKLAVHHDGQQRFLVSGTPKHAQQYRIHVELGGLAGMVAPLIGKEPPDFGAWISAGEAPTFLRMRGFLFLGGPIWQIELSGLTWSSTAPD